MKNLPANTLLNVAVGAGLSGVPIYLQGELTLYNPLLLIFGHFAYMAGRALQGIPLTKFLLEYGGFLFGFIYGGRLLIYIKQP